MQKATIVSTFVLFAMAAMFAGCEQTGTHAIDLRSEGNIVMRIPYGTISSGTFLATETKDGYFKLDNKSYTGDLLISELDKRPFLIKKGICLKLVRPSSAQKDFIDAMVSMCVEQNLDLFIDEPGGADVTKETEDVDWVVRRELSR
jgi:hypothetical protein